LPNTDCASNTDASCYCPSANFTLLIFDCLSSYGADDAEIAAAQEFYQGICAPYVPGNPAIITGASPTASGVTVTATGGVYTTVVVYQTITEPCTNSAGSTIASSSTIKVISTAVTVPQVVFVTATEGVVLVTGTQAPVTVSATTTPKTTFATAGPTTTKSSNATATTEATKFTGAASRSQVGAGVFGAAAMAIAMLAL
jgi:hypothetical protein